jgi:hypothetical protein
MRVYISRGEVSFDHNACLPAGLTSTIFGKKEEFHAHKNRRCTSIVEHAALEASDFDDDDTGSGQWQAGGADGDDGRADPIDGEVYIRCGILQQQQV